MTSTRVTYLGRTKWARRGLACLLPVLLLVLGIGACGEPQPVYVKLVVEGQEQILEITDGPVFVRDILQQMDIELGSLDRVEPDLYVEATDGLRVEVTRVEETFETERQALPFARETVRSEALPEGQLRLLQPGLNGEEEITYQVTFEDGIEVGREEVRRQVLVEPVKEIVLVGVEGEVTTQPISGTVVYLSGGNAWIMRESTDLRRNITGSGDLDGRVFALSGDGAYLLFTRGMQGDVDTALNSLWLARTSLVGEEPQYLGITGVIWAEWAPDGRRVAYSTAERSGGVPGWKANNDLWLITFPEEDGDGEMAIEQVLQPTAEIPYAWWGRTYAWSPNGSYLAYAQADGIGILTPEAGEPISLVRFPPYRTQSHWAWVPGLSWSSDSYLLAYVAHEDDPEGTDPEASQVFGLWVASIDGRLNVRLAEEVGMWAGPRWSPTPDGLLAYGQAQTPNNSQDSRYDLLVMDRDGSNQRHLFPEEGTLGLIAPEVAWSPGGDSLILEYEGNLYRITIDTEEVDQLTSDGQSTHPRWAK